MDSKSPKRVIAPVIPANAIRYSTRKDDIMPKTKKNNGEDINTSAEVTQKAVSAAPATTTRRVKSTASVTPAKKTAEKKTKPSTKKVAASGKTKLLFVASEGMPFITTGGMGEVIGALPKELAKDPAYDVRIVLPLYQAITDKFGDKLEFVGKTYVDLGWRHQYCGVFSCVENNITYYFIDNEYYFKRTDCYGYLDDGERFAYFCKAVVDTMLFVDFVPDVLHAHDWQSALVPVYLRTVYHWRSEYQNVKCVFTIHNIEYQGKYSLAILYEILDIPYEYKDILEYNGGLNLMKGAIVCSDVVTTVSPTYAQEIEQDFFAHGLAHIINMYRGKIFGIVNGIDTDFYNPSTDTKIIANYSSDDTSNKKECKRHLQAMLNLPVNDDLPVVAMITRLVSHKGVDIVASGINDIMQLPIQMVILGKGDHEYELLFESMQERYPEKIATRIMFNQDYSRQIYAGADMFLMPSRSEPCGLSQIIASRYGTVAIVRETGGLKDTIIPYGTDGGIGFTFYDYTGSEVAAAIERAYEVYKDKAAWSELMLSAMKKDMSWGASAEQYKEMYRSISR